MLVAQVRGSDIIPRMSSSSLEPQGTLPKDGRKPHLRVHCVNVFVRNLDRSLQFYLEQLGFELAFDARLQSGDRWVAVSPPDGTAVLTLVVPEPDSEEFKLI